MILLSDITSACQCSLPNSLTNKEYKKYDLIFIGSVLAYQQGTIFTYNYVIHKKYKGEVKSDTLSIKALGGMCGFTPDSGYSALMFVYRDVDGVYFTERCSRSCPVDEESIYYLKRKKQVDQDIKFLEAKLEK